MSTRYPICLGTTTHNAIGITFNNKNLGTEDFSPEFVVVTTQNANGNALRNEMCSGATGGEDLTKNVWRV